MKLVLLGLNEINFDYVEKYIASGISLPNFKKLLDRKILKTFSESKYENLEPWIQWPSIYLGKTFDEHQIFRLGDIVNSSESQIFEVIENAGFKVGAISPMNAKNNLKNPEYFIPDPWTKTPPDDAFLRKKISSSVSRMVNNNSESKISIKDFLYIFISIIVYVRFRKYFHFFSLAFSSLIYPWRRALFLDLLLNEIHLKLLKSKKPNFSNIFLNGGAHIQHHYFFNSKVVNSANSNPTWYVKKNKDPLAEMLFCYDEIIGTYLDNDNFELIIATALTQTPFKNPVFYYRLKNHEKFISQFNFKFHSIHPKMSRDFSIKFSSKDDRDDAFDILSKILVNQRSPLFGILDKRENEIFITLTYSKEIFENDYIIFGNNKLSLKKHLSFVAIKNGEHDGKGFAFFSDNVLPTDSQENFHVAEIYNVILNFFGIKN